MKTTRLLFPALLLLSCFLSSGVRADVTSAMQAMENQDNPLLLMRTSLGEVYLELFPQAAPRNVAHFVALVHGEVPLTSPVPENEVPLPGTAPTPAVPAFRGTDIGSAPSQTDSSIPLPYYDNLPFHRVLPGYIIQSGAPRSPDSPVPVTQVDDEINARQLGLHEEKVVDQQGNPHPWLNLQDGEDFQQEILLPLYRRLGITTPELLQARQDEVFSILRDMTLQQAYENMGYRYNERLPSRQPLRGAVAMAEAEPNSNRNEFFITLVDAPWLAGRATIIGQVVEGMAVADRIGQTAAGEATILEIRQISPLP